MNNKSFTCSDTLR